MVVPCKVGCKVDLAEQNTSRRYSRQGISKQIKKAEDDIEACFKAVKR